MNARAFFPNQKSARRLPRIGLALVCLALIGLIGLTGLAGFSAREALAAPEGKDQAKEAQAETAPEASADASADARPEGSADASADASAGARGGDETTREPAAPRVLPRYWEYGDQSALPVEGAQSVQFNFRPHEALCKSHYGTAWYDLCARKTGLAGSESALTAGLIADFDPSMTGVWRWQSDMTLSLQPLKPWPPGQTFRVRPPENLLPEHTELVGGSLELRSNDIMPRTEGGFKFDPQNLSTMALSGSITFNYPMHQNSVISRFSLSPQGEGLLLGDPALRWDERGNGVLMFSVPVIALPDVGSGVRVSLRPGAMALSGGKPAHGMDFNIKIPGRGNLFQLEDAQSLVNLTETMRARQTLALQFTLPAAARTLQPAVQALLLPRQRVNSEETRQHPPYSWWDKTEINDAVLAQSTPVTLTLDESADVESRFVSFGFGEELEPGRTLLVTIPRGTAGKDGLAIDQDASFLVQIPAFNEELRIMQNGAVLALAGDKTLSLYSRDLNAVTYEAAQIRPEFINHFVSANYGSFSSPALYELSVEQLSVISRGELPLTRKDAQSAQFSSLDLAPMLKDGRKGLFLLRLNGERGGTQVVTDQRFILVTDLGLIHKRLADGGGVIFTASLEEGGPRRGVTVQVLGANGLPVFEGKSDRDGRLTLPNLEGLPPEKTPVAIVAGYKEDLAFLPFADAGLALNYSRFDVGGRSSVGGLNAFLFTERDLYRPGEEARFGFLLKQGHWDRQELEGLPLLARLHDARGAIFAETPVNLDASGLGELRYPLPETAPTGAWHLDLSLADDEGQILSSQGFRVEEFQPDTLRLTLSLEPKAPRGWLRPADLAGLADLAASGATNAAPEEEDGEDEEGEKDEKAEEGEETDGIEADGDGRLRAEISLMNLFGAPAAGNRVTGQVTSSPAWFGFAPYDGWIFHDAAPRSSEIRESLPEASTGEQGDFAWDLPTHLYASASTRLRVHVEAFDASGGRSVESDASLLISPLEHLVGWRSASDLNYLRQNGEASVEFLAVDQNLETVALSGLTLETVAVTYIKSLIRDDNGQYRYDNLRKEEVLSSREFAWGRDGSALNLDLSLPGQRLVRLRDAEGVVLASVPYTVAGNAVAAFGQDREPFFSARLDKENYEPGGRVEVFLSTPYSGTGLITVERDDVVAQTWFSGKAGDQVRNIRLPNDFEGKAYLNVTYFRSLEDKDIFTRPLANVVVPFTVNMDARDMDLKLTIPGTEQGRDADRSEAEGIPVVRPGQPFTLNVSSRLPGKAIVFAVDEGILQMTSYRTPDPLKTLLADRALRVTTYQYLDLLMPEYSLMRSALSAYGGGEMFEFAAEGQNPFRRPGDKAAVFWSGVIDVDSRGVDLSITPPPYFNGQMRVMAVACSPRAVSSARQDVKVQAEVVIQPALPLFVAPGDEFDVAVTLTDMSGLAPAQAEGVEGRGLTLGVDSGQGLELLSALPEDLRLHDARQQTLRLRFRALDRLGGHSLIFRLDPLPGEAGESVTRPVGLSVRPAMPRSTELAMGRLEKDGEAYQAFVPFHRRVYPQFSSFSASLAALPLPLASGFMEYLAQYPYGCTEQVVSAAFPALVMSRHPELTPPGGASPAEMGERISAALAALAQRRHGGAFSLWPGSYSEDSFLNTYVADFLTTAEEMGVAVPYGMKRDTLELLEYTASQVPSGLSDARCKAYAAWVLTRNGQVTSNILATLNAWFKRYQPGWEQDISAVFMAGAWQLMLQTDEAERLIAGFRLPEDWDRNRAPFSRDMFDNSLSVRAFYLTVLAGQFPDRLLAEETSRVLDEIMAMASSRQYVTVSAAQTARALMLYSRGMAPGMEEASLRALSHRGEELALPGMVRNLGGGGVAQTLSVSMVSGEEQSSLLSELAELRFTADGPAYWHMESTAFERGMPGLPLSEGMVIRRELRRPDGSPATDIRLGDEIVVTVIARSLGDPLHNVAVTDLLPGCFEMVLAEAGESVEAGTGQGRLSTDRSMAVDYVERREDRLLLFPSLDTTDSVFRYRVRAANSGSFILPPIYAEAMYKPGIHAWGAADALVVDE